MIAVHDHRAKSHRLGRARAALWIDLPFGSAEKSISTAMVCCAGEHTVPGSFTTDK